VRLRRDRRETRTVPDIRFRQRSRDPSKPAAARQPQGVRVPSAAIVQRGGHEVVFALKDDNTVEQREVKTGIAMGDDRQVLSGLGAGDSVVLDPPEALVDGAKVRMAKDAATDDSGG
jgi:nitrous oxidase accessory protein NosD